MNRAEALQELDNYVMNDIKKLLKRTAGKNPDLSRVIVWVDNLDLDSGTVTLGLALGSGTGCSPFCNCAARDVIQYLGKKLGNRFDWVKFVKGQSGIPSESIQEEWNRD